MVVINIIVIVAGAQCVFLILCIFGVASPGASELLPHAYGWGRSAPLRCPTFQYKVESWDDEQCEERCQAEKSLARSKKSPAIEAFFVTIRRRGGLAQ